MEKKTESLTVHISNTRKMQIKRLAESEGLTASEFICSLIDKHLHCELDKFRLLQEVFDFERADRS